MKFAGERDGGYVRKEAISDSALKGFQAEYDDATIDKPAVFYYVYGVLHAPDYTVKKMRFGKQPDGTKDRGVVHYNDVMTVCDIPAAAYQYIINRNSAIEWVMDQYRVTVDSDSGFRNDPNDWSDDPRYILDGSRTRHAPVCAAGRRAGRFRQRLDDRLDPGDDVYVRLRRGAA